MAGQTNITRNIFFVGLALCLSLPALSQHEANTWFFGSFESGGGLNFNGGVPVADHRTFPQGTGFHTPVLSDRHTGELLLYTDEYTLYDARHQPLTDSSNFRPYFSMAMFVPKPGDPDRYYLLCDTIMPPVNDRRIILSGSSRYLEISTAAGQTEVVGYGQRLHVPYLTSHPWPNSTTARPSACVVPHANGQDYWLINSSVDSAALTVQRLTPAGFEAPRQISLPNPMWLEKVSPNGEMITAFHPTSLTPVANECEISPPGGYILSLLHFDPAVGTITQIQLVDTLSSGLSRRPPYLSFSPDNTKLYHTARVYAVTAKEQCDDAPVMQYETNAESIRESRVQLVPEGYSLGQLATGSDLQLGPDGKLYGAPRQGASPPSWETRSALLIFDRPNEKGDASGLRVAFFDQKGVRTSAGFPRFIERTFLDRAPVDTPCDPSAVVVAPNPARTHVRLQWSAVCPVRVHELRVYDSAGRRVAHYVPPEGVLETLRVADWASGLYLLHFQTSGGTFTRKLVVGR